MTDQTQCQTCFVSFTTTHDLRKHTWSYQVEIQRLSARIQESQVHLPDHGFADTITSGDRTEKHQCQVCPLVFNTNRELRNHVWFYQDEIHRVSTRIQEAHLHLPAVKSQGQIPPDQEHDAGDTDDEYVETDDAECASPTQQRGYRCPDPNCDKKAFQSIRDLTRHYTIHVECSELCVFCRDSFKKARKYIKHNCNGRESNPAKELYTRERCSQLRETAVEQHSQPDVGRSGRMTRTRDTTREAQRQPKKRQISEVDDADIQDYRIQSSRNVFHPPLACPSDFQFLGAEEGIHDALQMQLTPAPSLPSSLDELAASFSNGHFAHNSPFFYQDPGALFPFSGRIRAPIFRGITITPSYPIDQPASQLFSLPTTDTSLACIDPFAESSFQVPPAPSSTAISMGLEQADGPGSVPC